MPDSPSLRMMCCASCCVSVMGLSLKRGLGLGAGGWGGPGLLGSAPAPNPLFLRRKIQVFDELSFGCARRQEHRARRIGANLDGRNAKIEAVVLIIHPALLPQLQHVVDEMRLRVVNEAILGRR